jgi:adenosine deaminase
MGLPVTRELLRRLPKAELHCHLDGSVRPETLLELGREHGVEMPRKEPGALADYMRVDDARHLEDYLKRFEVTLSVMQHHDAVERIAYELVADAAADGVRYIEIRYAPVLSTRAELSMEDAVEATIAGIRRGEAEFGTVGRLIVCALRNNDQREAMEHAELAVALHGRGVVGFDLAGPEAGNPASRWGDAFRYARENDLPCTCHAGEGWGAESVRDAVHRCCVHRIGHGTRLFEDAALTDYVRDRRLPIEICLTSNVQTRVVGSLGEHPFRRYFDLGLNVVLNTDNRLMSGTTLTDEYVAAANHLRFSFDELAEVAINGFESAFLPLDDRRRLVDAAREEISRLRSAA